eukprot:TsM_000107200 transcript=TsM_000107200 gene=TsM_000107200
MPDVPRGRPDAPGDSGPYPRARGVDQLSRATPALVQRPEGSTSSPRATRASFRGTPVSTIGTGLFVPCPRVRGVDHISRATRFGSEGPRCRPAPLGDSGPGQRAHSVDQLSCATWARVRVPSASTRGPMARGVDQLSGATGAIPDGPRGLRALPGDSGLCQGPAVSNCSPGHLTLASEGPGVDQQARTTLARVRGPVKSTCGSG